MYTYDRRNFTHYDLSDLGSDRLRLFKSILERYKVKKPDLLMDALFTGFTLHDNNASEDKLLKTIESFGYNTSIDKPVPASVIKNSLSILKSLEKAGILEHSGDKWHFVP